MSKNRLKNITRLRRSRSKPWLRELLSETQITPSDLILPIFVIEGQGEKRPIKTMPDVEVFSVDLAVKQAKKAKNAGIKAIMLFPQTPSELKTDDGAESFNPGNLICRAIKEIKENVPEIGIISDVALDPYTKHGHDGVLDKDGDVENDATIEILCKQSLNQAGAGCDIIAPSDMMDGRVKAIREALDEDGFEKVAIMSYCAKYASGFYGPFRDAVGSSSSLKKADKKTYQMDFRNSQESIREVLTDEQEGADMLIIKPAMAYLDIVKTASQTTNLPVIAYHVSGEYAALKFAAQNGAFDFDEVMLESLTACKRAGARAIITYDALNIAQKLDG